MKTTDADKYNILLRMLHWTMALGFLFMWICGYSMERLVEDDSPLEELLFGLHISTGVTLAALLVLRIACRFLSCTPPLPSGISRIDRIGSKAGHLCLYLLPVLIVTLGWAETDFGGHGVSWFGISMPKLFPTMETLYGWDLESTTANLHKWMAYTMLGIATIHVLAVIKHRWMDGHDVLHRMTIRVHRR